MRRGEGARVSTRVDGGTALILVTAHATLSADPAHLVLSAREGPAQGTWRYNLSDRTGRHIQYGRITGMTSHIDVLRHAADICEHAYEPGTAERGLLKRFAESGEVQHTACRES